MTLQQLRFLQAIVDNGFSVSRAAQALHATQPGVSKTVRVLEREIGVALFVRQANRLVGLTEPGVAALSLARRVLRDAQAMLSLSNERSSANEGVLRLGTTHIHACYVLPPFLKRFAARFPKVELSVRQGAPAQILGWVAAGEIDLGLSTLPAALPDDVGTMPAYPLERCLIVPRGHPLQRGGPVSMQQWASYPLVAYHESFSTGWMLHREFQREGLMPRIIVRATDATVVKACVEAGVGVAMIPRLAVDPRTETGIRVVRTMQPLPTSEALFISRKDQLLRAFVYELIAMIAPGRAPEQVRAMLSGAAARR